LNKYRTLLDSVPVLIWTSDTNKLCDSFNKVWLDFSGRSLEQEFGNGWTEGVHPDDFQHCLDIYISAFDKREAFSMDYRLRRYDGEYRWLQDNGCPRYDTNGDFIGYIGYCLEITKLKEAEHKLYEQNKNLEQLIAESTYQLTEAQRIAHIGSWVHDHQNNELSWSDEVYRIVGLKPQETPVTYEDFLDIVHPDDRTPLHVTYNRSIADNSNYDHTHRIIRKSDGEERFVREQCINKRPAAGRAVKSIGTLQDVTDLVIKENALKEYANHVVTMIENERTRLARELHDDLGQSLSLLSLAVNPLKDDHPDRDKIQIIVHELKMNVDHMMESIRRICSTLRPALLDEFGLIAALELQCREFSKFSGIPCNIVISGYNDDWCEISNRDCSMTIFRIVQESLNNSMKHAGASRVAISLGRTDQSVSLEINDDGCGITVNKRSIGKSFGLIGMRERADSLGAKFEVISKKGKGTSVRLVIPCKCREVSG